MAPDSRIRNLMASPLVRKVLGLKFEGCWSGFGRKNLTMFS